uniref:DOCKER domain-containing protein n=1 Tax=Heterorhabditis bacteriophora TaxID=37862 RepID=A0A1I7WWD4_HETBA
MSASTFITGSMAVVAGEAPLASLVGETDSIVSADRASISTTSTFRRIGSGTSASAVLSKVRTPLQKRRFLGGGNDESNSPDISASRSPEITLTNLQPLTLNLNSFFRYETDRLSDEDLFKLLADARRIGGKLSRLKTFPLEMALQLSGGYSKRVYFSSFYEFFFIRVCSGEPSSTTLMFLKLDFLRIICSHEHFIVLNLPFVPLQSSLSTSGSSSSIGLSATYGGSAIIQPASPGSSSLSSRSTTTTGSWGSLGSGELNNAFRRSHFLVGLVLADLAAVLENSNNSILHASIYDVAIRCANSSELLRASLTTYQISFNSPIPELSQPQLYAIPSSTCTSKEKKIVIAEKICVMGITLHRTVRRYQEMSRVEEHPTTIWTPSRAIGVVRNLLAAHEADSRLSDPSALARVASLYLPLVTIVLDVAGQIYDPFGKQATCLEKRSYHIYYIIVVRNIMIKNMIKTRLINMFDDKNDILSCQMHMLACNQSVQVLDCIFASQRTIVRKYPELVFEQAAASLYLLMRESFENGNSLARVKMQITMSLSTLVSNGTRLGLWLNEDCLRRSLKTVLIYAETDASTDHHTRANSSFSEQVKDLVFNLHMILSDTVKMKEFANDFEMTMDLMYRIAKGYQNNPDLRYSIVLIEGKLTWLLNMSSRHEDKELYCEAGQCMLHAAALAAEYIAMTTTDGYMPRGAVEFQTLSDNILEESAVSDDVVSPDVDGICESRHFTAAGLVHLIEKSALFLEKAHMHELLPDVFKIIEPIVREWRDFRRLSSIHARLSDSLSRIEPTISVVEDTADAWMSPLRRCDKRCFGTYFRVGFYGSRFGDLDGEEFIYKESQIIKCEEPPFTKLSEISHRLELFYSDRFGKDVVEVIKDSNNVVRTSHQATKVYLQITYVEPYFDKWERRKRPTHFERSHKLKRFMYATPFTRDGKAHGDLKDQFKRRTILTTQYSFPYVKTRIRVIDKEQKVLQPIQVAIEDIEKKTRELSAAIAQNPPDAKMLQMVLQGCIGTTVNQGPIQVANVFLTDITLDERGKPVDKLQNKLRLCFRDFSKKCADALTLNKYLIQSDQLAYQMSISTTNTGLDPNQEDYDGIKTIYLHFSPATFFSRHIGVYKLSLECKDSLIAFYELFGFKKDEDNNFLVQRFSCDSKDDNVEIPRGHLPDPEAEAIPGTTKQESEADQERRWHDLGLDRIHMEQERNIQELQH